MLWCRKGHAHPQKYKNYISVLRGTWCTDWNLSKDQLVRFNYLVSLFLLHNSPYTKSARKKTKQNGLKRLGGAGNPGANILQPELWIKITQQVMHNTPASTQKHITLVLYGAIHSVMYMRCNVHCTAKSDTCSHFMAAHRNPGYCAYSTAMQFNTIGVRIGMTGTEIAPTNNCYKKSW